MPYIYLFEDRRGKGKHIPRAVEAINLGFATDHNMSAYKFYVPSTRKMMLCNQAKFDELFFPYRTLEILERDKDDHRTNILGRVPSGSKWVPYDKSIPSNLYDKVHYDSASDVLILRLTTEPNTNIKTILSEYFGFSDGICCLPSTICTRTTRRH
jgi:hypothetical protein